LGKDRFRGERGVVQGLFGIFSKEGTGQRIYKAETDSGVGIQAHERYANLVGLFEFQKELEEEKGRLSKLGYCPYVIPRGNGEALLCVGAFYQKARAQRQHAELASKGIHSEIVER
jgi:hypothetical protein